MQNVVIKKIDLKRDFVAQVFICLRPRTPFPLPIHSIRVYSILIHTGKGRGGRVESERKGWGNSSQSWVENTIMLDLTFCFGVYKIN
jgi:hypothetical protein